MTRLQTLLLDSLIEGLRGSMVETPSTLKLYLYAPGATGPIVSYHTPFSAFVRPDACPTPGMSPAASRTASARGA